VSKISALIPARGGSKGIPKKNIKNLCGYPLLAYSIKACQLSDRIERIIVSTDDENIAEVALKYGAEVPFMRPLELSQDNSTDNDVINHYFEKTGDLEVAYLRPTTPLRDPSKIDQYLNTYFETQKGSSTGVRSVHELPESPYKMFVLDEDGYCRGFFEDFNGIKNYTNMPRQAFPPAYQPNGYLDIIKKETLLNGDAFGNDILPVLTDFIIEVDTDFQFKLIEAQLEAEENILLTELGRDQNQE
jgi:CMP-N-acetylneuraminic acid synthetase